MILPCSWHDAAPQLMNTSFLPAGTGLPIGLLTVMALGRLRPWFITAWAWLRVELETPPPEPEPLLLEEPQAVAPSASSAAARVTPAARRYRCNTGVRVDMFLPPCGFMGSCEKWSGGGGPATQARPAEAAAAGGRSALQAGDRERGDQDDADEHVRRPLRGAGEPEPGRARAEQEDRDDRPPRVEAAVLELRRAQEGGGEGGQQVGRPARRRSGLDRRREHDPSGPREAARRDERHEAQALDVHA